MNYEEYNGYVVFENGLIITPQGTIAPKEYTTTQVVKIGLDWHPVSYILAKLFLEYAEGKDYVSLIHAGNGVQANNLQLTDKVQRKGVDHETFLDAIKHIETGSGDLSAYRLILNGGTEQGEPAPIDYPAIPIIKKSGHSAPIIDVTDLEGNHVMYGSARDITDALGYTADYIYKTYSRGRKTNQGHFMNVVAFVPKQHINAMVDVYYSTKQHWNGEKGLLHMETIKYAEACMKYNLHFESLSDLLEYSNSEEPVLYQKHCFKIHK